MTGHRFGVAQPVMASAAFAVSLLLGFIACGKSPTEPGVTINTNPTGALSGTWSGTLTCSGRPSESLVATLEQFSNNVTMKFVSSCYGNTVFKGFLNGNQLTGQLTVPQMTCREGGFFINVTGVSSGTAEPSRIHLDTAPPGTFECGDLAPGSTLDLSR